MNLQLESEVSHYEALTPSSSKRPWSFEGDYNDQPTASIPTPHFSFHTSEIWEPITDHSVCFGSIVNIKAQLNTTNSMPPFPSFAPFQVFSIVEEGSFFALSHHEIKFARLSKALCATLKTLVQDRLLRFQAVVKGTVIRDIAKNWHHRYNMIFPMELNIYGLVVDAVGVGRILSKSDVYLQFPKSRLNDIQYSNPHLLQIEGFENGIPPEETRTNQEDEVKRRSVELESQTSVSMTVDKILDSLSQHVEAAQISVDRRIRSTLLPHQKEAVAFMNKREIGNGDIKSSLWKYNNVDPDESFYRHVFTGAKRPLPDEARGGIIADEMGLGKSLVILSIIAGSLDRAGKFVAEHQTSDSQQQKEISSGATLILVPSSLLVDNWVDEIRKHTYPGALSFHRHLGMMRHKERHLLQQKMIVFTTYATVATEFRSQDNPLARINWFRIVLDEAHDVRNRTTKQYQAVSSLEAQQRWCLTGTPIQNDLDDLGALASFLKVPVLESAPTFRKFITIPSSRSHFENLELLLQSICMRRTRGLLALPEPKPHTRRIPLTNLERTEYNNLLHWGRAQIDMAVSGHRKGKITSTVLEFLLKLRIFCNNGSGSSDLHCGPNGLPEDPDEALTYLQQFNQNICTYCAGTIYCLDDSDNTDGGRFAGNCFHLVCHSCFFQHRAQKEKCPSCISAKKNHVGSTSSACMPINEWVSKSSCTNTYPKVYPSKLSALLYDLSEDNTNKSIVFSCWKKTLNLVGELLLDSKIPFHIIDGSLALKERLKVLRDFRAPDGANILLMTLGTGAVGLNLAVASRIYLLEPQWNPSIESQAIGRALRLGQTEQVMIIRYIMAETVEESNVLDRQKRKLQLAGGGFGGGKDAATIASNVFRVDVPSA